MILKNKNILPLYFYTVNLELSVLKKPLFQIKPLFHRKKNFISVIKPLYQKPKPLKKTLFLKIRVDGLPLTVV